MFNRKCHSSKIYLIISIFSRDSEDSLNYSSSLCFRDLLITEPANDMPSITRGVGRKASLETENNVSTSTMKLETDNNKSNAYARRGSDKSLGFSDDSLSNDSNHSNLSPQEPSCSSSGFKSVESRLSPDSLCETAKDNCEEYYELPLPNECSNLDTTHILELVKRTIDSNMPQKGFALLRKRNDVDDSISSVHDMSNLNLEYSSGLQIELQVLRNKDSTGNKGIKLRRISGDQYEYGKLCQQLITSLSV